MFHLRTLAVAGTVMILVSLPAGLAAQDATTAAEPCPAAADAAASPSATSMATAAADTETSAAASPAAETCGVEIRDFAFNPDQTEIASGTTVTWTNEDSTPHTVTAAEGAFDSGPIDSGASFSHTFDEAGTFDYHCTIHPSMQASIVVR